MLKIVSIASIILLTAVTTASAKINIQSESLGFFDNGLYYCNDIKTNVIIRQHWEGYSNSSNFEYKKGQMYRHTVHLAPNAYINLDCYAEGSQTWASITAVNNGSGNNDLFVIKAYKVAKESFLKEAWKRPDFHKCPYVVCQ